LKDKSARFEHCTNEDHLNKFNAAEEERIQKEELEKKNKEPEEETPQTNENSEEKTNDNNQTVENGDKSQGISEDQNVVSNNDEVTEKPVEEPKDETNQEEG